MRTKRFLSLVLAIAMLCTMAISASAYDTKVYLAEDFTSEDGEASTWLAENHYSYGTGSISVANAVANYNDAEKANGKAFQSMSSRGGILAASKTAFITNSKGSPALKLNTNGGYSQTSSLLIVPSEAWNSVENAGETYVISYETQYDVVESHTGGTNGEAMYGYTYFTNAADRAAETTTVKSDRLFTTRFEIHDQDTNTEDDVHDYKLDVLSLAMFHNKNSNAGIKTLSLANGGIVSGQAIRVAHGYYYDATYTKSPILKVFAVDGDYIGKTNGNTDLGATNEATHPYIAMYQYGYGYPSGQSIANLKMYTIKNGVGAFNVSTSVADVVPTSTTNIPVKFSQPVAPENFNATDVTATKNGEALTYGEDFTVSSLSQFVGNVGGETYSTVNVVFADLEPSSEYVVTFPTAITNEIGTALAEGYNTISFSTPEPDIKIEGFEIVKGWGTASEATASAFVADGTLQGASIELTNTTESTKNVAVIYAVYGSNGQLTDVVYANRAVNGNTTEKIGSGVNLAATGSVKAFVWDGISSLKPHSEATVRDIVAAE